MVAIMWKSHASRHRDALYHILIDPLPDGTVIGAFQGRPIPAVVIDSGGRRYEFAGLMPRNGTGEYDLSALARDEWIVEPGLIYRRIDDGSERTMSPSSLRWSETI
jgi:hypothetical protein